MDPSAKASTLAKEQVTDGEPASRGDAKPPSAGAQEAAAPTEPGPVGPETTGDWAICCSGGGIRSATYCLGALQTMDTGGLVGKARWILGVSGGSYIAASRALVADSLNRPGDPHAHAGQGQQADERRPYARGSAEEENLRNNSRYIAPDAKTALMGVLSLLLGAIVTFILATAPLFVLGHAWGWLLRGQGVLTWSQQGGASASVTAWTWWPAAAAAAAVTLALFVYWWATLGSGGPGRGTGRARWVGWSAGITAALALLMLVVPLVIERLYHSTGALGTVVQFFGFGGPGHWSPAALAGVVGAIAAVARFCQAQLAKLKLPAGPSGSSPGLIATVATWARTKLTPWLASLVIIGIGAFLTLLWVGTAARTGYSPGRLWPVLIAAGIVLGTRALADINRTSLHDFYRWRLADAYAVTRQAVQARRSEHREKLLAKAASTRLSQLSTGGGTPDLVIACTANINANRAVPAGRGGYCLAFDPKQVTLRGNPHGQEPEVRARTEDYEYLLGHTRFTLFDVVAISGAAFSPLMGAATRGAYRILLTLTNLRLGIWMPHPDVVRRARAYLDTPPDLRRDDRWWTKSTLLLVAWYVGRHPFWHRDPGRRRKAEDREARLWAHVLDLRERSTQCEGWAHVSKRLRAAVCWRVMQPTLGMLWAEAAGHTSYRATWVNVTDGGHYDNLGLVEALRRGARNIVVLDASGDRPNTWFTLGGAMALARADAGVDITLDPTVMANGNDRGGPSHLGKGQVLQPWARGTFAGPNGHAAGGSGPAAPGGAEPAVPGGAEPAVPGGAEPAAAGGREQAAPLPPGKIWVCKLGWWEGAPWDVRAYALGHPDYPCDPTLQQLYDGAEFEAYQALGVWSVKAAANEGELPLALPAPGG
jgi:hypothetical protein